MPEEAGGNPPTDNSTEAHGNDTILNIQPEAPATPQMIMGGVKTRARLFTEGIMIMVCPVFLAIARDSVESKTEENKKFLVITRAVAAATLLGGIVQFLVICVPKTVDKRLCEASKCMVHICVLLVMGLASVIMSLIGLKSLPGYLVAVGIIGFVSALMGYCSWREDGQAKQTKGVFEVFNGSLEASANFSAAVTAVLFLGLEALALEGLMKGDANRLDLPIGLSFATCGIGVLSMLLVSVHPLIYDDDHLRMAYCLQVLSVLLGICVAVAVYYFTEAAVGRTMARMWLTVPCVPPSFLAYNYFFGSPESPDEKHELASLELTKITFAAFLAVSVTDTDTSTDKYTGAFIWLTAAAIITGVEWRLMTHWKKVPAAVARAADAACFISHLFMAFAVIPFALLAAAKKLSQGAN